MGNSLFNGVPVVLPTTLTVIGTILDDAGDPFDNVVADPATPIVDQGYTINSDGTGMAPGPGSIYGTPGSPVNAMLGPLGPNGGPTLTHELQPGSPAIDAFDFCADLAGNTIFEDQRAVPRPVDGDGSGVAVCDIGAFEAPAGAPSGPWQVSVLHPSGGTFSRAFGIHGVQQAGHVVVAPGNAPRASRWEGASSSWADIHPAGASVSVARAVHTNRQVGDATIGGVTRASFWSGSAGSHVDLHGFLGPGYTSSFGRGVWVAPGGTSIRAVGHGNFAGPDRAALWQWNGASWSAVNLHPGALHGSGAFGVHGNQQVGHALDAGVSRASLWTGSAASWLDLNAFLPAQFLGAGEYAVAEGIWSDGASTAIVGWAQNTAAQRFEALMWTGSGAQWAATGLHPSTADESRLNGVYNGKQVGTARVAGVVRASFWSGAAGTWEDLHQHLPPQYLGPGEGSAAYGVWDDGTTTFVVGEARNTATSLLEAVMWIRPTSTYVVTAYCPGDGSFGVNCPHGTTPGLPGNNNDGSNGIAGCAHSGSSGGGVLGHSIAGLDVTLVAFFVSNEPRLWLQGDNAVNGGNGIPFLDGLRCAGVNVIRLEIQSGAVPAVMSNPLPPGAPGQILRYQLWFRDSGAGLSGANLTNGLQIVW